MLSLSFYPTEALKSLRSLRLINHPAGVRICANEQNCIQYDRRKSRNRIIHGSDFSHMFDLLLNLSSWDMLIINSCSLDFYGFSAKCNFLGKNGVIEAKIVEIVIYGKIVLKYIAAYSADLGRIKFAFSYALANCAICFTLYNVSFAKKRKPRSFGQRYDFKSKRI